MNNIKIDYIIQDKNGKYLAPLGHKEGDLVINHNEAASYRDFKSASEAIYYNYDIVVDGQVVERRIVLKNFD